MLFNFCDSFIDDPASCDLKFKKRPRNQNLEYIK